MTETTSNTLPFPIAAGRDVLSGILHEGAQRMLSHAIEAEVAAWLDERADLANDQGRRQVVRNGHLPERTILTQSGEMRVKQAKRMLHETYLAATKRDAEKAFDLFVATYEAKYPNATECLAKDREALLTLYDFPAEHWIHIRSTNPMESVIATVRLRHNNTKGNGSRKACLAMVFKLMESDSKRWRTLNGSTLIPDVIAGVQFADGVKQQPDEAAA